MTKTRWWLVGLVCLALAAVAYVFLQGGRWETYMAAATSAYQQGNYTEAEKQLSAALREAEGFGLEDPRLAASLSMFAQTYTAQGRYGDAEPLYKRSLAILEEALGPEHPHVAQSLETYALLLHRTGRIAEADRLETRAKAIRAKRALPTLAATTPEPRVKIATFRDCDVCPEMVIIPEGDFTMGSPESEKNRSKNEGPQHRVTIGQAFALGKYEVTFAEWDACVSDGGCDGYRPPDSGWGRGNRPVIYVRWHRAKAYVAWLSRKTGKRYRLPSEAEWEYAARAGTTTPFHVGSTIGAGQANFYGIWADFRQQTVAVGSFPPNAFGIHDVHGNVSEWAEDCWHGSYTGASSDGGAWTTGGDCGKRVLRGGSWSDESRTLHSANRRRGDTGLAGYNIGFRVARTLAP